MVTLIAANGRRIEVTGVLVLGREAADVEFEDAQVSRRHAAVRPVEGGVEVEDLGTRNGTFVDGIRIDGVVIVGDGGTVRVGETRLSVEAPAAEPTTATSAPASDPGATRVSAREVTAPGDREHTAEVTAPRDPEPAGEAREVTALRDREHAAEAREVPPQVMPPAARAGPLDQPSAAESGDLERPFGAYAATTPRRRRRVATRLVVPALMTYTAVGGTALALAYYFATR